MMNKFVNRASDVHGLERKLSSKLSAAHRNEDHDWQVGNRYSLHHLKPDTEYDPLDKLPSFTP